MGHEFVVGVLATDLQTPDAPAAAVHSCFCARRSAALRYKTLSDAVTFCVRDVHTNKLTFRVRIKALIDAHAVQILNFRQDKSGFDVFARADERIKLFDVDPHGAQAAFQNVVTGMPTCLRFKGSWHSRSGVFWFDEGLTGSWVPIAKMYPAPPEVVIPDSLYCPEFYVNFAPMADTTLVTLLCATMFWSDEMTRE